MKHQQTITVAILLLAFTAACAGCITVQPAIQTSPAEATNVLDSALTDIVNALSTIEKDILIDMNELSGQIGAAETDEEIHDIMQKYYSENLWLVSVLYQNTSMAEPITVPVYISVNLTNYPPAPTEEDFNNASGFIVRTCVFTAYHGYVTVYYKPVYTASGAYGGAIAFVVDVYSALNNHPELARENKGYSECICAIADKDGRIVFSSLAKSTGVHIRHGAGYYDGIMYLPDTTEKSGACRYTSTGFYNYAREVQTEKITAWRWMQLLNGGEYIVYAVQEQNKPEMQKEDIYEITTAQALKDVRDAYAYARMGGSDKLADRIMDGYYESPMYLFTQDGDILASPYEFEVGKNGLNCRGTYGNPYVQAAILAARQGGGFIYYALPIQPVIFPRTIEYCIAYVLPVDDERFLYTRFAGSTDALPMNKNLIPDIDAVSRAVLKEAGATGIEAVIEKMREHPEEGAGLFVSNLTTDISGLSILDMEGMVYASMKYPESVGTSVTGMTDAYGGSMIRRSIMLAKMGGGIMTNLTPNPEMEGYVDLWVVDIEPINDTYYCYVSAKVGTIEDVVTPYRSTSAV